MSKTFSVNMISTVTNQVQVHFMTYKGGMNAQVLIRFMKRLMQGANRKIFLIVDNLRVHHSRRVQAWIKGNSQSIEVFYLPSYWPGLNPDAYLNCDRKYALSDKPSPRNRETRKKIINHLRKLQKSPERVQTYFRHKSIKYAT